MEVKFSRNAKRKWREMMAKEVKMKMGELLIARECVNVLYHDASGAERKMSFKTKLKLTKIRAAMESDFNAYDKARIELIQKYGEEVETEGEKHLRVKSDEESQKAFFAELTPMLETEVELAYPKLTVEDIDAISDAEIEISEIHMAAFTKYLAADEE